MNTVSDNRIKHKQKLRTTQKLSIGLFILGLFLGGLSLLRLYHATQIHQTVNELEQLSLDEIIGITEMDYHLQRLKSNIRELFLASTEQDIAEVNYVRKVIDTSLTQITHHHIIWTKAKEKCAKLESGGRQYNHHVADKLGKEIALLTSQVETMITIFEKEGPLIAHNHFEREAEPLSRQLQKKLTLLKLSSISELRKRTHHIEKQTDRMFILEGILLILTLIFLFATKSLFFKHIATPIEKLCQLVINTKAIMLVDMGIDPNIQKEETSDEVSTLLSSFEAFEKALIDSQQKLKSQNESLEKRVALRTEEVTQFAYMASHDLKSPLRGIEQVVDWIKEDYGDSLDTKVMEYLGLIENRVERMVTLIEGILDYNQIGSRLEKEVSIHTEELTKDIISFLEHPPAIEFIVDNHLPTIKGQKTGFGQVIQNLIDNAIKYMDKPDGIITIRSEQNEHDWLFYVTDNGPGIDTLYHQRIFQIFQVLQDRNTKFSSGIGLSLVKKIVEKWGGSIGVESELGKGSTFWFSVPKVKGTIGQWGTQHETGHTDIDQQHQGLFKQVRDMQLLDKVHTGYALDDFISSFNTHSLYEESEMKKYNYPLHEVHTDEHKKIINKLLTLKKNQCHGESLAKEIESILCAHEVQSDKVLASFLLNQT
jgi:hemerythrin-like metal-binding protein